MDHRCVVGIACTGALLLGGLGCGSRLGEEAQKAREVAKAADARVAALEKELQELKAAKVQGDPELAKHVSASQAKALERQLEDARKSASDKLQSAKALASGDKPAARTQLVEVPAGAKLRVKLARELTTEDARAGDRWEGVLVDPVTVGGKKAWEAGTPVKGVVTESAPAGRLSSGQGGLGIRLTRVGANDVDAGTYMVVASKRGGRNAKFIGGGAALGALVGLLSDREHQGDHALGGAVIGAAAGTAAAAASADTAIRIPTTSPIGFSLKAPEKVLVGR